MVFRSFFKKELKPLSCEESVKTAIINDTINNESTVIAADSNIILSSPSANITDTRIVNINAASSCATTTATDAMSVESGRGISRINTNSNAKINTNVSSIIKQPSQGQSADILELRGHGPPNEDCLAFMTLCKTFEQIEATTKR